MVCPHTQRPICSIFLSWIAVLNNVRPRLWWPGEYSIVFRGTTDKIWSLLPIHHSNLNRDFKLRPPNIRKFWSTATATAICKSWWWLRLTEPIHGEIWSRLPLEIAVAVEDRCRGWGPLGTLLATTEEFLLVTTFSFRWCFIINSNSINIFSCFALTIIPSRKYFLQNLWKLINLSLNHTKL